MTRECMDCRAVMGEKCPRCGTENLTSYKRTLDPDDPVELVQMFVCQNALCPGADGAIKFQFEKGDGPNGAKNVITTGLCRRCLNFRMEKLEDGKTRSSLPVR